MRKEKAEAVLAAIAAHHQVPVEALSLFDHDHEGLSKGSWVVVGEGVLQYEWPWLFTEEQYKGNVPGLPDGVFLEAINGCSLGIYDPF